MKIRTGDTVVILTGKDKGKQGAVIRVLREKDRVVVEGINMRIRHIKRTPTQAGQRISYEASIHVSNVAVVDPKTKKPTRIGWKRDEKTGAKQRIAKKSGEVIAGAAKAKAKDATKADEKRAAPAKQKKIAKPETDKKSPFWKRGEGASSDGDGSASAQQRDAKAMPTAHRSQGG